MYIVEKIFAVVSLLVTYFLGKLTKKSKFISNKLIPIQNLLIGIISAYIYYRITNDISLVVAGVGLFTGGTYDIANNLKKLLSEEEE